MKRKNENRKQITITMKDINKANKKQFAMISRFALKTEKYFIAEYYENLSKEIDR